MATSTFRSTTERSSGGRGGAIPSAAASGSSSRVGTHRRSRSLSRYSGRFPPPPPESDDFPTPRGRFVNKLRGSGFPEISVDDLADEFFRARAESEEDSEPSVARNRRRSSTASYLMQTESSRQRGRSMSKPPDRRTAPSKGVMDSASRRRRSVSVARHRCSDSENDEVSQSSNNQGKLRNSSNSKLQQSLLHGPVKSGAALRRSMSQMDFLHSQDSYSSHSSLTDDEALNFHSSKCGDEKMIQTVHVREKGENPKGKVEGVGLYELMSKQIEKVMAINEPSAFFGNNAIEPKSSEVQQAIAEIKRNFTTKLEQSEKRKQDLLAELAMEEERGQELSKIVKELLPSPKTPSVPGRQSRSRRSNDRTRMSKHLTEEAEKYFEDFLSNVEDTDISSFDGERSDTSSIIKDPVLRNPTAETLESSLRTSSPPVDADGVLLPWLKWETSSGHFSPCKSKPGMPVSGNNLPTSVATLPEQETNASLSSCSQIASSFSSWSPGGIGSSSIVSRGRNQSKFGLENLLGGSSKSTTAISSFDMEEYLSLKRNEELLFERLRQRQRVESGSIILCGRLLT
ncbi:hypothetical protein Cni_G22420 [Canna indica]|uniref:Uncharacterized protein n=1 Tax=Canna indica TaxID=4628 RepID=A0AAQ3KR87_9LILI|nr:hypothetical protein Cni_G22420 [Canna indica]